MSKPCTCRPIRVGMHPHSGSFEWDPDCPHHGEGSNWYEKEGRINHYIEKEVSRRMQGVARKARIQFDFGEDYGLHRALEAADNAPCPGKCCDPDSEFTESELQAWQVGNADACAEIQRLIDGKSEQRERNEQTTEDPS